MKIPGLTVAIIREADEPLNPANGRFDDFFDINALARLLIKERDPKLAVVDCADYLVENPWRSNMPTTVSLTAIHLSPNNVMTCLARLPEGWMFVCREWGHEADGYESGKLEDLRLRVERAPQGEGE